jgi:anti-anti-sigma factor
MNLTTSHVDGAAVIEVHETRLTSPMLADFATAASTLISSGTDRLVVDLSAVGYVDSATIGLLMDLYRQATAAGGGVKLAGVQKRVETMLTMTGAHQFLELHPDRASALSSFGG